LNEDNLIVVDGDLLDQKVEVIVNPWNRNLIPWWLLIPKGVSGAIKRKAGFAPFRELRRHGVLPLGGAAVTSAGRLPFKAIIHVAGINHHWCSSEASVRKSVKSALDAAIQHGYQSLAMPLIGAGTGGGSEEEVQRIIEEECKRSPFDGQVVIVRFKAKEWPYGHCYCDLWNKSPEILEKQGVPKGFCGLCDKCGQPGHLLHFPGAVPFTGAWCEKHYYRAMILHPMGGIGFFIWGLGALLIIWYLLFKG
jgi:O-acetyl-ADP-ribose deacetylase (regulator of RNase III)